MFPKKFPVEFRYVDTKTRGLKHRSAEGEMVNYSDEADNLYDEGCGLREKRKEKKILTPGKRPTPLEGTNHKVRWNNKRMRTGRFSKASGRQKVVFFFQSDHHDIVCTIAFKVLCNLIRRWKLTTIKVKKNFTTCQYYYFQLAK